MKYFNIILLTFVLIVVFSLTICNLNFSYINPNMSMVWEVDMSGTGHTKGLPRSLLASSFELSSFEKYEVEVVYIYIALFDTRAAPGSTYGQYTLYNERIGNGTKVDLANENLSDKLPVKIKHPIGSGIDKIYIGLGTTVTAKGYINNGGTVYRTRSDGTLSADGDSLDAEEGVFPVMGHTIPAYSVDESEPPVEPDVKGIYLLLADGGGGKIGGHEFLHFQADADKLDLKIPLELGLNPSQSWRESCDLQWVTPYINGASRYEKYYLKRTGATYYTDVIRILSDNEGNAIVGQLLVGNLANPYLPPYPNPVFPYHYAMWYNVDDVIGASDAEINATYAEWFQKIDNTTIYFKAREMWGNNEVIANNFQRTDHSGTITVNNVPVSYDCIRIE